MIYIAQTVSHRILITQHLTVLIENYRITQITILIIHQFLNRPINSTILQWAQTQMLILITIDNHQ